MERSSLPERAESSGRESARQTWERSGQHSKDLRERENPGGTRGGPGAEGCGQWTRTTLGGSWAGCLRPRKDQPTWRKAG